MIISGVPSLVLWWRKGAAVEEPEDILGKCDTFILAYYAYTLIGSGP
jgi:hypothetical protein